MPDSSSSTVLSVARRFAWLAPGVVALVLVLLPVAGLGLYWQREAVQIGIYYLLASSLNLVLGYGGEFAVGQVAVMAAGAYTTAILFNHGVKDMALAMIVAMVVGVLIALATGLPSIRLTSWTLGLVTFFLVLTLPGLTSIFQSQTGGLEGISGLLSPKILGIDVSSTERYFTLTVIISFIWAVVVRNMLRSRFGLALLNMREGPLLTSSLGLAATRLRMMAYAISSIPAAIAGCIYTYFAGFVSPDGFSLTLLVAVIATAVVGGLGSVWGPALGAVVLVLGPLRAASFARYSVLVYGGFLVFVAVVFPLGMAGAFNRLGRYIGQRIGLAERRQVSVPSTRTERPALVIPGERLVVSGVTKRFGGVQVLYGVDMAAEPGQVTALIGPNGAGKTTLLNIISGFIANEEGTITVGDRVTTGLPSSRVARLGVGRTFQTPMVPRSLSVREVVQGGRFVDGRLRVVPAVLRLPGFVRQRREDQSGADEVLAFAGLGHLATQEAGDLPLGTRRLLEVVRAVAARPHVVLLDEPAAGLDDDGLEELGDLIRHMRDAGATVVLVEHNVGFVLQVADTVHVLNFGEMIASGSPEQVRHDPKVIECYLGGTRRSTNGEAPDQSLAQPTPGLKAVPDVER